MAETKEDKGGAAGPGEAKDPILDRSLSGHFVLSSVLLFATMVWAIADEIWLMRPYGTLQREFRALATEKTEVELAKAEEALKAQEASPEFQAAQAALKAAEDAHKAAAPDREKLGARFLELTGKLNEVRGKFQIARGDYQPLVYFLDHANLEGHAGEAKHLEAEIKKLEPDIQRIFGEMDQLSREKKDVQAKLDDLEAPVKAARDALRAKLPAAKNKADAELKLVGLKEMGSNVLDDYQTHVPALNLTDRCRACHLAIDKPGYSEEDWEAAGAKLTPHQLELAKAAFSTHPNYLSQDPARYDWLATHNIEKFGCTSCHWGNGPATTSAEKAHGLEGEPKKSWTHLMEFQLTPILPLGSLEAVAKGEQHFGNMMEAACGKCHAAEVNLRGAPQLSYGRQIVEDLGCWGCHKIKGFELKELESQGLEDKLAKELKPKQTRLATAIQKELDDGGEAFDQRQALANTTHDIQVAERRISELDKEIKFIGPDLNRKDLGGLKNKIYWAWLPRWISSPQHYRPGTWMPNPLLAEEEALDVAAYIWQQAGGTPTGSFEPTGPSDAKTLDEGKRLVAERGCLACHTLTDQGGAVDVEALRPKTAGGVAEKFAANDLETWWKDPKAAPIGDGGRADLLKKGPRFGPSLARVGEKIRYEWLVEWVKDPKRIQPHTRMPNLRLTDGEAKAIAAFLTTLRQGVPGGERFAKLDRARLESAEAAARGFRLVIRQGCFNCHAIDLKDPANGWKEIVNPGKIGAELSSHGSKPLAQFDFGFVKVPETRQAWLQTKIIEPRIWDRGKYKGDPNDRLRMPRFGLSAAEAAGVNTVLVGLTDQAMPAEYVYRPKPREAAIIEGERLVRKFNCRSCHVIDGEGQWAQASLQKEVATALGIPEDDARLYLPPLLNGQGHRSEPGWLFKFLKNPGLYQPLRPWHVIRMPTFEMSDAEAIALVEYFSALEKERYPYEAKEVVDDPKLVDEGRTVFVKAQCASCHKIGEFEQAGKKPTEQGPNLAWAHERLRPDWIERLIPDPQAFIPGANMPSFFDAKPFTLQSPEKQREIQALRAYIRQLDRPEFREQDDWVKGGKGPSGPR